MRLLPGQWHDITISQWNKILALKAEEVSRIETFGQWIDNLRDLKNYLKQLLDTWTEIGFILGIDPSTIPDKVYSDLQGLMPGLLQTVRSKVIEILLEYASQEFDRLLDEDDCVIRPSEVRRITTMHTFMRRRSLAQMLDHIRENI